MNRPLNLFRVNCGSGSNNGDGDVNLCSGPTGPPGPGGPSGIAGVVGPPGPTGPRGGVLDPVIKVGGGHGNLAWDPVKGDVLSFTSLQQYQTETIDVDENYSTDLLGQLRPKRIQYDESVGGKRDIGFTAEQVASVDSLFGTYDGNGQLIDVNHHAILSIAVRSIQDLQRKVDNILSHFSIPED